MIIDVRTHFWSRLDQLGRDLADRLRKQAAERFQQYEGLPSLHEASMGCVDAALVFGFQSQRLGANVPNELIAEYVARDPGRRLGVAGIDPMAPGSVSQVDAAVALGLIGVSVSPSCQGFHPAHSQAMRVYERCAALSLPLFVTSFEPAAAASTLEFARPSLWDEVAQSFPSLPIVIGAMGYPWIDETLVMLGKHPRLYADIAGVASRPWQLYNALLSATSLGVMNKLLFGSGFPFEAPEHAIEALYSLNGYSQGTQLPAVPRSQVRGIVERDSLACLGIDAEFIAAGRLAAAGAQSSGDEAAALEIERDDSRSGGRRFPGRR